MMTRRANLNFWTDATQPRLGDIYNQVHLCLDITVLRNESMRDNDSAVYTSKVSGYASVGRRKTRCGQ